VLNEHDIEKCAYELDHAELLVADEAYVLPFPVPRSPDHPVALKNILNAGLARPGCLLIQSPFEPNTYDDAETATERFALTKHVYFSEFCMYLGAREVSVDQIDLRTASGRSSLLLKGEKPGVVSGAITATSEELDRFRAQLSLRDEFTGGAPELERAERHLRHRGLWSDPSMHSLLDMRRSESNHLLTRTLTITLSSESKRNLDVVARLRVPAFVRLSANYNKIIQNQSEFTLTVTVRF